MVWLNDKLIRGFDGGLGNGMLYCTGEVGFSYLVIPGWGVQEAVGWSGLSSEVIPERELCRRNYHH